MISSEDSDDTVRISHLCMANGRTMPCTQEIDWPIDEWNPRLTAEGSNQIIFAIEGIINVLFSEVWLSFAACL